MSQFWRRRFELLLLKESGEGIALSDFSVDFNISWTQSKTPRMATITVYNLRQDTVNRLMGREFAKLRLCAGYFGLAPSVDEASPGTAIEVPAGEGEEASTQYGTLFSGDIRIAIEGRSGVDSWVKIQALDGFEAYSYATISATLAKGYTEEDVYNLLQKKLEKDYGILRGQTPVFPTRRYPRGKTFNGNISAYLDEMAKNCHSRWQFLDGRLEMYNDDMIVNQAVVLNAQSGLINSPQRTTGAGITATCLINPAIRINGLVHIDRSAIAEQPLSEVALLSTDKDKSYQQSWITQKQENGNLSLWGIDQPPASLAGDGVYVVRNIVYHGSTRGDAWYMDLTCQARGDDSELKPRANQAAK
ncbi:hypothetical protein GIX45_04040 [Erwinia sp. CPCC 100877]|nr:hypothetical protein [Erwinia sp. CPCC 100877]